MNTLQSVRGTKDLLPDKFKLHKHIIETAHKVASTYGFLLMDTPIIEYTKVFDRTLGDTSDIVSKEMYSFLNVHNESISLRPEFTAGVMRCFIENKTLWHKLPLKFMSYGPLFRYDRPQAGRQRQFHQLNFEHLGAQGAHTDAEIIKLAFDILKELSLSNNITLELNSLGCVESRTNYETSLYQYFDANRKLLSQDSIERLNKGKPLRILDSKHTQDQELVLSAPIIANYYTHYAKQYFNDLIKYLEILKVKYTINSRLVRGLDYYTHTVFEFTTKELSTQSSLVAGGRYDGLAKLMGGPDTTAIGFAAGIERLALMSEYAFSTTRPTYLMPIESTNISDALRISDTLRQYGICIILCTHGKIGKRIQNALASGARYIVFIGDNEIQQQLFKLKDLEHKQEYSVSISKLIEILRGSL